jgi:hypothetical protein
MKRAYASGQSESANFFIGQEVEHTPAYGLRTLFIVGVQDVGKIEKLRRANNCKHIFFGANHSFNPDVNNTALDNELAAWNSMIAPFLSDGIFCTLDIPLYSAEATLQMAVTQHNNFIGQMRVAVPFVTSWNYNTMIKIDDKDFDATNPGVWAHSLHDLMNRSKFTDGSQYNQDTIIGE